MHPIFDHKKNSLKKIIQKVYEGYTLRFEEKSNKFQTSLWQLELNDGKIYFKLFKQDKVVRNIILIDSNNKGCEYNIDVFFGVASRHIKLISKDINKTFGLNFPSDIIKKYNEQRKRTKRMHKVVSKEMQKLITYNLVYFKTRSRKAVSESKVGENEIRFHLDRLIKKQFVGYSQKDEYTTAGLSTRADTVVFSKEDIHVFEIKSDRDSFSRLADQIKDYRKYADYIHVVLHIKKELLFMKKYSDYLPEIGLIIYDPTSKELLVRNTPSPLNHKNNLLKLLWKEEKRNIVNGVKGISKLKNMSDLEKYISRILKRKDINNLCRHIIANRFSKDAIDSVLSPGTFDPNILPDLKHILEDNPV